MYIQRLRGNRHVWAVFAGNGVKNKSPIVGHSPWTSLDRGNNELNAANNHV